jgi:hypothetical protein
MNFIYAIGLAVVMIFLCSLLGHGCCSSKQIVFDNREQMERWISEHPKVKIAYIYPVSPVLETECK